MKHNIILRGLRAVFPGRRPERPNHCRNVVEANLPLTNHLLRDIGLTDSTRLRRSA